MRKFSYVWLLTLTMGILALFYGQYSFEKRFKEHWHHAPKDYNAELTQRKLLENPGYLLTKPRSGGYVFWSVCWR